MKTHSSHTKFYIPDIRLLLVAILAVTALTKLVNQSQAKQQSIDKNHTEVQVMVDFDSKH
jgi:hypothetical protein